MSGIVDTHCHLNLNSFEQDLEDVLARAWERGVTRILIPGTDLDSSRRAVELAHRDERLFAAVGYHPNEAGNWQPDSADRLRELAGDPKVVAVGEIGLDYYWNTFPAGLQTRVLLEQLALADELHLPVVLHSRNALNDLLPFLAGRKTSSRHPGVLHSFDGTVEEARQAWEMGYFIGITGPVTFRNAPEKQLLVQKLPLESLLIETDAPYLTPQPYRGRRNEPAYVYYVVEKIAQLRGETLENTTQVTTQNANLLLKWD